jgi:hypothetical protein
MVLDPSEEVSTYIEDYEVCCRPIEISFRFEAGELVDFEARKIEGI